MGADKVAFQASDTFCAAILVRLGEILTFNEEIAVPANDRLHPYEPLWARSGWDLPADRRCVGFKDGAPNEPPPDGLSRAKSRLQLIPVRGEAGARWRAEMRAMNRRPRLGQVFREHGVEDSVLDTASSTVSTPGMCVDEAAGQVWLIYGAAPRESEHLLPRKLSEFYAASEASEERKAARAEAGGV